MPLHSCFEGGHTHFLEDLTYPSPHFESYSLRPEQGQKTRSRVHTVNSQQSERVHKGVAWVGYVHTFDPSIPFIYEREIGVSKSLARKALRLTMFVIAIVTAALLLLLTAALQTLFPLIKSSSKVRRMSSSTRKRTTA